MTKVRQIVDFLLNNQNSTITLDVSYYIDIIIISQYSQSILFSLF